MRKKLRSRLPGLSEIVYWYANQQSLVIAYSPSEHGYEAICSLAVREGEVRLYFAKSPQLATWDPGKLLKGSGKSARYVAIDDAADLDRAEIETLFVAALDLANVKLVPGAEGAVILKAEEQEARAVRTKKVRKRGATDGSKKRGR